MVTNLAPINLTMGLTELCSIFPFPLIIIFFVAVAPGIFPITTFPVIGPKLAGIFIITGPQTPLEVSVSIAD